MTQTTDRLAAGGVPQRPPLELRRSDRIAGAGRRFVLLLAALIPAAALGVFFCYPVAAIVGRGLVGPAGWDLGAFADVLSRSRFTRIVVFTVGQAAASAGLALLLGVPGAHLLYRRRFRSRGVLRALITVPFVLPTVVVGLAFRTLFAESGWLGSWGWDGSVAAILAAHVFFNYAVVVRTVGATWTHLDTRPAEVARSLGASPARVFATVTLPALGPALASAAIMVFLFCATSFGIILVMGGARYNTIETEIYRQTALIGDLPTAAVLSILQMVLVAAVLVVAAVLRRRTETTLRLRGAAEATRPVGRRDLPAVAMTLLAGALLVLPMAVLVTRSLQTADGWGLDNYRHLATVGENNVLLVSGTTALANSIRSAVIAAALSLTVGVLLSVVLARRPRGRSARRAIGALDGLMMLPLGVSAVTVGFGFLIALDAPPLDFRSSALLVPIAQAMVATPLVVRMVLPVLRAADQRLRQAAAVLGAGPVRVWASVDLPIMSRALAAAGAFALATGLGEFGATTFVARPETVTLPVVIGRLISRPGPVNSGMALAAGVILAVACAVVVLLVDLAGGRGRTGAGIGGF
ncbi:MAG TPA: iron ABC transporter permease [Nakamurella sp.]|nr:iron ABC transporter permease [Nakamurella sp.]